MITQMKTNQLKKKYVDLNMDSKQLEFNMNEDKLKRLVGGLQRNLQTIHLGGGEKSAAKQKSKGKLLARERIEYLKDKDADFLEIGAFAGHGMYQEHGGCPAGGVVGGITRVGGRPMHHCCK